MGLRYRLLALDMDGTLLDPRGEVGAETVEAIAAAMQAGVQVVLASGRAPRHMIPCHRDLGLTAPIVAHNGSLTYDVLQQRVLRHESIDIEVARRIAQMLKEHDPAINLHVESQQGPEDLWSVEAMDERLMQSIVRWKVEPPHSVGTVQALLADEATRISKLWFHTSADTMAAIKHRLLDEVEQRIGMLAFDDVSLTILSTGVSKASGIAWVAERYGIRQEEVMAIGDELNDVPMLGWAGLGVAMGNATPPAREVAAVVTTSNAEAGVAWAIERWLLAKEPVGAS